MIVRSKPYTEGCKNLIKNLKILKTKSEDMQKYNWCSLKVVLLLNIQK